jgi:phage shock protein PspC (stress-responsive transcriptional regulator)
MKRVLVLLVAGSILSGIAAYAAMAMPAPPEKPNEKPNK